MPVLSLGLNDESKKRAALGGDGQGGDADAQINARRRAGAKYVELEGVKFHQCVQLDEFEKDRNIKFIPPDGKFELMSYRVKNTKEIKPLFLVEADLDVRTHSRVIVTAKLRSQYRKRLVATSVDIAIPVPPDADTPRFRTNSGTVVYSPERNAIVWQLKNFAGSNSATMKAELHLPSVTSQDADDQGPNGSDYAKGPVQLHFEIPYLAASGLQVRYLKVTEPRLKYSSLPWVRYLTNSGSEYSIRLNKKSTS
jgi:AP-1 complex subunit mu